MIGFHDDGRRKYKSFYGKTQKEVKDKAKAYQSAKAEGIEMDVVYTFEEWADMWFESHKDNIMPTTQENYKYTLRTLKSFFGRRKIRDIKPFDIEMMLKKLRHDGRSLLSGSVPGNDVSDHAQGRSQRSHPQEPRSLCRENA